VGQGPLLLNQSSPWYSADTLWVKMTPPVTLCTRGIWAIERMFAQLSGLFISQKASFIRYSSANSFLNPYRSKWLCNVIWHVSVAVNWMQKTSLFIYFPSSPHTSLGVLRCMITAPLWQLEMEEVKETGAKIMGWLVGWCIVLMF